MASTTMTLEGLQPLVKRLDRLEKKARTSIARKAVNAGATPVLKAMRANAPTPGFAKDTIKKVKRSKNGFVAYIGQRTKTIHSNLAHLFEFGNYLTRPRRRKATGEMNRSRANKNAASPYSGGSTGNMPATRFATRAWDSSKGQAFDAMAKKLASEIESEAAK